MTAPVTSVATPSTPPRDPERERGVETAEINDLDFWDLLDVINPLQHIPVVSTFYRALTGDTIKPAMRVLGGALYGGPVGLMTAYASAAVELTTGREPVMQLAALALGQGDVPPRPEPQLASGPPVSLFPPARPAARDAAFPPEPADMPAARAVAGYTAPAGPPPWLAAALDETKAARDRAGPAPWLVEAMAGGLDKYAALDQERRAAHRTKI